MGYEDIKITIKKRDEAEKNLAELKLEKNRLENLTNLQTAEELETQTKQKAA